MLIIAFFPTIVLTAQYFGDTARFGTAAMYLAVTVICIAASSSSGLVCKLIYNSL